MTHPPQPTAVDVASDTLPPAPPRPAAGTPSAYRFPHFATRILANGLRLIVANVPAYPVVTTLAVIEAGATRDPRDYEGLAQLTTRALAEGTRDMNALELTSRLEMLGTTLDTGADWDSAIVQITALSSRIDDAVAVLSEVLRYPAFPESELERMRGERLADLAQLRAEPRGLSDVFFSRLLYQPASRFARLAGGDEASTVRLTREQVLAYHQEYYRPDATALMMVGDIDVEHAVRLASTHFGDWAGTAPPGCFSALRRRTGPRPCCCSTAPPGAIWAIPGDFPVVLATATSPPRRPRSGRPMRRPACPLNICGSGSVLSPPRCAAPAVCTGPTPPSLPMPPNNCPRCATRRAPH